jgi:hypothetical protein
MIRFINIHRRKLTFVLLSTLLTMWFGVAFSACAQAFGEMQTMESSHSGCPSSEFVKDRDYCGDIVLSCACCLPAAESPFISLKTPFDDKKGDAKIIFPKPDNLKLLVRELVLLRKYPVFSIDNFRTHPSLNFRVLLI